MISPQARRRVDAAEGGMVLLIVITAILIATVLISALVVGSMGETSLSRQQLSGQQAFALAEAGAYRGLAELRHRLTVDLESAAASVRQDEVAGACETEEGWRLLAAFAHAGSSDWEEDPAGGAALLEINGGEPLIARAIGGEEVGRMTATVRVRSAIADGHPSICERGTPTRAESYRMFFHYEITGTGMVGPARRSVRLASAAQRPIEVVFERASLSRWGMLVLKKSEVWLTDGAVIEGPAHANERWWIWGSPTFAGPVTTTDRAVHFGNCGSPVDLEAPTNPGTGQCGGDVPRYRRGEMRRGLLPVSFPQDDRHLGRLALGLEPHGQAPEDQDIRVAAPDQVKGGEVEAGLYVPNHTSTLRHPQTQLPTGLYVKGDVDGLTLAVESGRQVLTIKTSGVRKAAAQDKDKSRAQTVWKIIFDDEAVRVEGSTGGGSSYRGVLNGLIYVDGDVKALSGTVHRKSQLTVAARGTITLVDHLVYELPPEAPSGQAAANLLGLYSLEENIEIDGEAAPNDIYVDAVILAPQGKFYTKDFNTVPDKGTARIFGGVVQGQMGEFGSFDPIRGDRHGYTRVIRYDQRLRDQLAPPYFPRADRYAAPRPRPDTLYDKPVWQEVP